MDLEAMKGSPIGQLVPIEGFDQRTAKGFVHEAFLPDPLPMEVSLSASTWTLVARAEAALGRLDEASQQVPEPRLLREAALRREAQSTSALEGTFAPFEDVMEPELDDRANLSSEVWEILNYVAAAEQAFAWIESRPVTSGLIAELQRTLVWGTAGELSDAGSLRDRQVVVGSPGSSVIEARFVPPPPGDRLTAGVDQLMTWIREGRSDLPPVVRAALGHYQFETLHPFSDGNGRIGRLMIVLQLMRDGVLREPILVVSPWLEAKRSEYQDGLLDLSRDGDWDRWVEFFATGIVEAADAFRKRIEVLLSWRDEVLEEVRAAGVVGVAERVAAELIGAPVLTASRVARDHRVSHQGAMKALRRLVDIGLLVESEGRISRRFAAPRAMELLEFRF
ncbi:MAG TPA: Fic/DOC family N-terminal domain-containing protein [Solirubrobacterales bacterium]|nr:Fic/DOC family N-terminal domain-containing protein [Solirubrobacterales bacterium]